MTKKKQLIFDSRYGWVYDEWRDPVSVAHLGGRGMFAIVPLGRAAFGKSADVMNEGADLVAEILQKPPSLQLCQSQWQISIVKAQEGIRNSFNEVTLQSFVPKLCGFVQNLMRRRYSKRQMSAFEFEYVESNKPTVMPELQPGSMSPVP